MIRSLASLPPAEHDCACQCREAGRHVHDGPAGEIQDAQLVEGQSDTRMGSAEGSLCDLAR
jgi:hypothetical protein